MSIYVWTSEIKNIVMWPSPTSMQWPCSTGFHVPSNDENIALVNTMTALGIDTSNWNCMKTYLKMPFAGRRKYSSASVNNQDTYAYYWSSTMYEDNAAGSYFLFFQSSALDPQNWDYRSYGCSVRPFKDTPTIPTNTWTTLYSGTWDAGIFHDTVNGLISLSSDGINRITIADKNLWATTVYNSWDTLSQANCWYYYQRWNNYGFAWTWSVTTSSTKVNASNYWPGNYYSSSTFITVSISASPYDWSSVQNDNLRWWVSWAAKEIKAVYVWSTKVRPAAPTLLFYYPLKENLSDYSWNNYNLAAVNGDYQFATNSEGIKCAILNYSSTNTYFQISSNYPIINLSQNSFSFGFYICDFDKSQGGSSSSGVGAWVLCLNKTFKIDVQNHAPYQSWPDGWHVPEYEISSSWTQILNGWEYVTWNQFKKCILRIDTTNNISDFRIDGVMVEKRTGLSGWRTQNQFIIGRDTYDNKAGRYIKWKICNLVWSLKVWDDNDMNWFNSLN